MKSIYIVLVFILFVVTSLDALVLPQKNGDPADADQNKVIDASENMQHKQVLALIKDRICTPEDISKKKCCFCPFGDCVCCGEIPIGVCFDDDNAKSKP